MRRDGTYDLVILGGGTGGLVSAFIAAAVGARVALVERERTGGDCLWTGCVPSKSLLATAELVEAIRHADRLGIDAEVPRVDLARVMERIRAVQSAIEPHDSPERLEAAGVDVLRGDGRFVSGRVLDVDGRRLRFHRAIVATGSEPVVPPVPGLAGTDPLTSETIWGLRELPRRLVVVGGGPIGCELGQAFTRLGSRMTLLEAGDRLLPRDEPEASALVAHALREEGVDLRLGAGATGAETLPGGATRLHVGDGDEHVEVDRVLVAAGRAPRTAGVGLEAAGVELDERGAIRVDGTMRTSSPRILAVGDVTGGPAFTHLAAHHARHATLNALFGLRRRADRAPVPWVTFTDPEVAHVGLTEAQARERWDDDVAVARSDHAALDRALTAGATRGGAVLVGDRRGRLVGATLMGRGAGDSIAELTAWITTEQRIDRVSQTIHAYPTYAESAARAADEHVRARVATPRTRRLVAPVLAARRLAARMR